MKRFPILRTLFSLALLCLAASALASSMNISLLGQISAAFLPVAILAMGTAYWLGLGRWTARRSWALLLCVSLPIILLSASRTWPAIWQILIHLPALLISALFAFLTRQSLDLSFFQAQLGDMMNQMGAFLTALPPGSKGISLTLREVMWDVPLFLVCAWSGWWSSRRNTILIALIPSLGLQVFLLNFAHRPLGPTLQVGVFVLIFLMGLHQKWNLSASENKTQTKVRMKTHVTVFLLASVLAMAAGWVPILPVPEKPIKPAKQEPTVIETIEKNVVQINAGPPAGLPRNHQINAPSADLMEVIFLANTGETPLTGKDEMGFAPVVPRYYWRWITYDLYNGKTWSSSPTTSASYSADQALFEFKGEGYRMVHQTIIKASTTDKHLYWTGSLMDADQPMDTTWRAMPLGEDPLLSMDMLGSLTQAQQYSADSLLPQYNETQLREASRDYPAEILEKYLALPRDTISQRVRDLAVTLTYQAQNPYDKAKAIEAYLRTYPYTLDVPAVPSSKEISDYFLFELKTGYCEYYATSMIVMARSIGLPSRMVIGYASSEYDTHTAQYIIREAYSHSWVEIYFPNIGWVEFEPTASQPLIDPPPVEDATLPIPLPSDSGGNRNGTVHQKHGYFPKGNPVFAVLPFILAVIGICLWYLYKQGLRLSYPTIGAMYQHIYHHGKKIHPEIPASATPSHFAERLNQKLNINHRFLLPAADQLNHLTSLYLKETYSPRPITEGEQEQAVKIWQGLFWRLLYMRTIFPIHLRLSVILQKFHHMRIKSRRVALMWDMPAQGLDMRTDQVWKKARELRKRSRRERLVPPAP